VTRRDCAGFGRGNEAADAGAQVIDNPMPTDDGPHRPQVCTRIGE
jgi:hypothetical protein